MTDNTREGVQADRLIAAGDRVVTTKAIRMHTHDGVFIWEPGRVGIVEWIMGDGIPYVCFGGTPGRQRWMSLGHDQYERPTDA